MEKIRILDKKIDMFLRQKWYKKMGYFYIVQWKLGMAQGK